MARHLAMEEEGTGKGEKIGSGSSSSSPSLGGSGTQPLTPADAGGVAVGLDLGDIAMNAIDKINSKNDGNGEEKNENGEDTALENGLSTLSLTSPASPLSESGAKDTNIEQIQSS